MQSVKFSINYYCLIISIICLAGCQNKGDGTLRIAVAANAKFAFDEITKDFTAKTGIKTTVITGSSGKLTAQILNGAPFHVFVSADISYPLRLYEQKMTTNKPATYALGTLVFWTLEKNTTLSIQSLDTIQNSKLAIANPLTAPYGKASIEVLNYYKIYEHISQHLVVGENISQATQYVLKGGVQQGFTALSMILSNDIEEKCSWLKVDEHSYSPLKQGIVILKSTENKQKEAKLFFDYLFSTNGQKTLMDYGYKTQIAYE